MAVRFRVVHGYVKYKREVFYAGQLMPLGFTARDKARNVHTRRLMQVEIPDEITDTSEKEGIPIITDVPPIINVSATPVTLSGESSSIQVREDNKTKTVDVSTPEGANQLTTGARTPVKVIQTSPVKSIPAKTIKSN